MLEFDVDYSLPFWYHVDKDNPAVLLRLGDCFAQGEEVPRDLTQAQRCYLAAVEKENFVAAHRLSQFIFDGVPLIGEVRQWMAEGLDKDDPLAIGLWVVEQLTLIARQGLAEESEREERLSELLNMVLATENEDALLMTARAFAGDDEPLDPLKGLQCALAACEQGNDAALTFLALNLFDFMRDDPATAPMITRLLAKTAPTNAVAAYRYAQCLDQGFGVEKNQAEAVRWLEKAANGGFAPAAFALGWAYDLGEGVEKNTYEAVRWYSVGAEGGHLASMYALGIAHLTGEGCSKSVDLARRWLQEAAEKGNVDAMLAMAHVALIDETGPEAQVQAFTWLRRAAEHGNKGAMELLSSCYLEGVGCERDPLLAEVWARKAKGQI